MLTEAAAGAGVQYVFGLNNLYDPDVTGAGHQPMYYDQLFTTTGPYQRWTVTNCHVEIVVANTFTSVNYFGVYVQPGTIDYPSLTTLMEKPTVHKRLVGSSAGLGVKTIRFNVPINAAFGVPRQKLIDDDVYSGFWNSAPSQILYLAIMVYGLNATIASNSVETTLTFTGEAFGLSAASPS
jgi:hypothetical protein